MIRLLGLGMMSYAVMRVATGKIRRDEWLLYLLALLSLARFAYIAVG